MGDSYLSLRSRPATRNQRLKFDERRQKVEDRRLMRTFGCARDMVLNVQFMGIYFIVLRGI